MTRSLWITRRARAAPPSECDARVLRGVEFLTVAESARPGAAEFRRGRDDLSTGSDSGISGGFTLGAPGRPGTLLLLPSLIK